MTLKVSNGSAFVDAKNVQVSNGSAFVQAKKIKVWNGTAWVLSWVPAVGTMTMAFSKTGVVTGEAFTVSVSYPAGFPEGTTVRITTNTGYDQTFSPADGATSVTTPAVSHSGVGSPIWSAVATNLGGVSPTVTKTQTVTAPAATHYHKVLAAGATGSTIQSEMDKAYNWWVANQAASVNFDDENDFACVELPGSATYQLSTALHMRRGVRLVGAGSGASRPIINGQGCSHVFNTDNNGGGAYNAPHYDWLIHNIIFDCSQYSGGFSIAHTKRFRISSCLFKNMGGKKHYVEINSSGGARADGTYNCHVKACEFTNSNKTTENGETRRTEDECIQFDYSWPGAASAVAGDGTITNNVLIENCNFHEAPRAIGSHHWQAESGGASPKGIHANILIRNNTFTNINPSTYGDGANGRGSEGAIRAYVWENVSILNNVFDGCYQPINLYIPADGMTNYGNPTYYRIAGNTIRDQIVDRPGISSTSGHASLKHDQILVEDNTFDGTWSSTDYAVGMEDTGTSKLANSSYGVVIRRNAFIPSNKDAAAEKAYNKYRADGADNGGSAVMVQIYDNTVSDGTVDNS